MRMHRPPLLRLLLFVLMFVVSFQIGRKNQNSLSANPLLGRWEFERVVFSGFDGTVTVILKPTAGEVYLGPDGQFRGYFLISPKFENSRKELSGRAVVNSAAETVEVTEDLDPVAILFKYRLKRGKRDRLELEGDPRQTTDRTLTLQSNLQIKITLNRKN